MAPHVWSLMKAGVRALSRKERTVWERNKGAELVRQFSPWIEETVIKQQRYHKLWSYSRERGVQARREENTLVKVRLK